MKKSTSINQVKNFTTKLQGGVLVKASILNQNNLSDIKKLVKACARHDKYNTFIYWHCLTSRLPNQTQDFFFYSNGKLVAYLGLFSFSLNEVQISAMVEPAKRKQGLFKMLLKEAIAELKTRQIVSYTFISNKLAKFSEKSILQYNFRKEYSMYTMSLINKSSRVCPPISLRQACEGDLDTLSLIYSKCFDISYINSKSRILKSFNNKDKDLWIAIDRNNVIGEIHLDYVSPHHILLHGLCILPEYRRRHYASAIIINLIEYMLLEGYSRFTLNVLSDNYAAIRVYQYCGFEIVEGYDFWRADTNYFIKI